MKNEKSFRLIGIVLLAAVVLSVSRMVAFARLSGTNPTGASADAFCVGKAGGEACVASNGDLVPTTTGVSSLGTSTLLWLNSFVTNMLVSGNLGIQQLTTAQVQAKTPTAAGQLIYNSTLKLVCVSTGTTIQGYSLSGSAATCQ